MQEQKEKGKPKERVREGGVGWRGAERKREEIREGANEGGRMEGNMGEGRKEKGQKEKEEGRKKSNNLRAFLHNDSITHAAKENQTAYEE